LDLHTTSAEGFFAICTESKESEEVAMHLHAPVVKGLLRDVKGSLIQYYDQKIGTERIISIAFEAGQHQDPKAADRMIGVILHLMEYLNMLGHGILSTDYYHWLEEESKAFPKEVEVIFGYKIKADEIWEMLPGFKNFMPVLKNQTLAGNQYGSIVSPFDGLILMPRYQPLGNDGFFIVKTLVN
jgi:succinylglutamate desuccinylase